VLATNKFIQAFLFGVTPNDPCAILGSELVLVVVAVLAGYGLALRASKIDPWNALRHE
jgi:ABC-type lipoprotein release transport system permease subunit